VTLRSSGFESLQDNIGAVFPVSPFQMNAKVCLCALLVLVGCGDKTLKAKDLKNNVEKAISIASEAELFARLDAGGEIRDRFRIAHLKDVEKKVEELNKELAKAKAEAALQGKLDRTKELSQRLASDVASLHNSPAGNSQEDLRKLIRELAAVEQGL
jgi:hypothetical protein